MNPTLIGALIAAVIAIVSLIVNAILESRRGRRDLLERQATRAAAATAQDRSLEHERAERRYEDRKETLTQFLAEADRLIDDVRRQKYADYVRAERQGPPNEALDRFEMQPSVRGFQAVQARLDLLAGAECRLAAKSLYELVTNLLWSWDDSADLAGARDIFLEAARADLDLRQATSLTPSSQQRSITS